MCKDRAAIRLKSPEEKQVALQLDISCETISNVKRELSLNMTSEHISLKRIIDKKYCKPTRSL